MLNSSIVITKRNSFVIGARLAAPHRLRFMKRKPLSDADRQAAANLKEIWGAKKDALKLTQDKAAELLGFATQGAVSHYLNGRTPLNTDAVLKFAALLDVSPTAIRPDLESMLLSAAPRASGLSVIATAFIAWVTDQATQGKLTDDDLLLLRGRAEQLAEQTPNALRRPGLVIFGAATDSNRKKHEKQ